MRRKKGQNASSSEQASPPTVLRYKVTNAPHCGTIPTAPTEPDVQIKGYKYTQWKVVASWVFTVFSLGFLQLILFWKPIWRLKLTARLCPLAQADTISIKDAHHQITVKKIITQKIDSNAGSSEKDANVTPRPTAVNSNKDLSAYQDVSYNTSPTSLQYINRGGCIANSLGLRYFSHQQIKYIWSDGEEKFIPLMAYDNEVPCGLYQHLGAPPHCGLSPNEVAGRRAVYSENHISIRLKSIPYLLFREVLNPFYVFQIFSILLWYNDEYWNYATCIVLISVISLSVDVYQINSNQKQLRDMIHSTGRVDVHRRREKLKHLNDNVTDSSKINSGDIDCNKTNEIVGNNAKTGETQTDGNISDGGANNFVSGSTRNSWKGTNDPAKSERNSLHETLAVMSTALVPGDIITIDRGGCMMQCDAVLLEGTAIVNESMLTGESVPVTKTAMPAEDTDQHTDKQFTEASDTLASGSGSTILNNEHIQSSETLKSGESASREPHVAGEAQTSFYNSKDHARHTLFCGTQVLQARCSSNTPVRAVVIRTGFYTTKGELIRSIMYPKPVDYHFTKDLFRMVGILVAFAVIGFIYSVTMMMKRGMLAQAVVLRSLDIITIVVPPTLPLAMTVGIIIARSHLKKQNIYCISPSTINTCGEINVVVFDKTGTLTETGLNFQCLLPVNTKNIDRKIEPDNEADQEQNSCGMSKFDAELNFKTLTENTNISNTSFQLSLQFEAMAACHSLTFIDNVLSGDPLDLILFQTTSWTIDEPQASERSQFDQNYPIVVWPRPRPESYSASGSNQSAPLAVGILKQFTFSSSLQRMSVIVREIINDTSVINQARPGKVFGEGFTVFCKGAPEMIASLSRPSSLPTDFHAKLQQYTLRGYRVIALSYRRLALPYHEVVKLTRQAVECNLRLIGLVVLENRLKPESTPVIGDLHSANIRTIMATGDNIQTALSVARECSIIKSEKDTLIIDFSQKDGAFTIHRDRPDLSPDSSLKPSNLDINNEISNLTAATGCSKNNAGEYMSPDANNVNMTFDGIERGLQNELLRVDLKDVHISSYKLLNYQLAMTGKVWSELCERQPSMMSYIACSCCVFARMAPEHKASLVNSLQEMDYVVAMCGDGANDCGALKAAHAGISLSDAEASIASPFTSRTANISCVPIVIREGRAALVTSFGAFKYMANYSLCQFFSVSLLYWIATVLADYQFIYIDLFLITTFAAVFGYTDATEKLAAEPPPARIFTPVTVASIGGQIIIQAAYQIGLFVYVTEQPWFTPFFPNKTSDDYHSYQVTIVFLISCYQYIILVLVHSKGAPHRKSILNNKLLTVSVIITFGVSVWITICPADFVINLLDLMMPPEMKFRLLILVFAFSNMSLSLLYEWVIVDYLIGVKFAKWRASRGAPEGANAYVTQFDKCLVELRNKDINWWRGRFDGADS